MSYIRRPTHAGTDVSPGWYPGDGGVLAKSLLAFMQQNDVMARFRERWDLIRATSEPQGRRLIGLIGPHAGLRYSGPTSSVAYKQLAAYLNTNSGRQVKRIIMMGPSHRKYFEGIEVSGASTYQTPLLHFPVDVEFSDKFRRRCLDLKVGCNWMVQTTDEDEHSLEMHLPLMAECVLQAGMMLPPVSTTVAAHSVATALATPLSAVSVVPLMFGNVTSADTTRLGHVLAPLLASPENVFVISSDFCHWGARFRYVHHYLPKSYPRVEDSVVALDLEAIRRIERRDITLWESYMAETRNTICGRSPITALLKGINMLGNESNQSSATTSPIDICFLHYAKSGKLESEDDSSVSYASAVILQ